MKAFTHTQSSGGSRIGRRQRLARFVGACCLFLLGTAFVAMPLLVSAHEGGKGHGDTTDVRGNDHGQRMNDNRGNDVDQNEDRANDVDQNDDKDNDMTRNDDKVQADQDDDSGMPMPHMVIVTSPAG